MRLSAARIAYCLSIGTILSVAVAFACGAVSPITRLPDPPERSYLPDKQALAFFQSRYSLPVSFVHVGYYRGLGTFTRTIVVEEPPPSPTRASCVQEVRHGWPLYAFAGERHMGAYVSRPGLHSALPLHAGSPQERLLGFRPLPLGLTANIAIFAVIAWFATLGFRAIRASLRRRRHLCRDCAYPVGRSPICSECGASQSAQP